MIRTSSVIERISSHKIRTINCIYSLDKKNLLLSHEILHGLNLKFINGFPENWKIILNEHQELNKLKTNNNINTTNSSNNMNEMFLENEPIVITDLIPKNTASKDRIVDINSSFNNNNINSSVDNKSRDSSFNNNTNSSFNFPEEILIQPSLVDHHELTTNSKLNTIDNSNELNTNILD